MSLWNRMRYTVYAPFYDRLTRPLEKGRRRSLDVLALRPGEHVLIVGAGTGLDFDYLPRGVRVTAVDVSPGMLRQAEARARARGLEAECHVMDARRLAFPATHFDAVVLHLVLAVVPDPEQVIAEVARVLKPDGRVMIFDKFLPDTARPSLPRRLLNVLTRFLFSDINRRLGPLLDHAGLRATHEEASVFGGAYRVVRAENAV